MATATTYSNYLLSTPSLGVTALWPMNDGSGATMGDLAPTANNGTYVASPTLNLAGDEYSNPTATVLRSDPTVAVEKYGYIPCGAGTKITQAKLQGAWSMSMWVRKNSFTNVLGGQRAIFGFRNLTDTNFFEIGFAVRANGTNNSVVRGAYMGITSDSGTEVIDFTVLTDGNWHLVWLTYDPTASSGSLTIGLNDTSASTVATNMAARIAAMTTQTRFGIGESIREDGTPLGLGAGYDFAQFAFHDGVVLTAAQRFSMANVFNGNQGVAVEFPAVAQELFRKTRTRLATLFQVGDSNMLKATAADGVTPAQGFVLTAAQWIYSATSRKLAGYLVSSGEPGVSGIYLLGINETMVAVPNGTPPTHIDNRNLLLGSAGLRYNCDYFAAGTLTAANSKITMDTSSQFWSFASPCAIRCYYDYAVFSTGSGVINPSTIVNGVIISFTTTSTNTGIDSWNQTSKDTGSIPAGQTAVFGFASTGHNGTGPLAAGFVLLADAARENGFQISTVWALGGSSAVDTCTIFADTGTTPLSKLTTVGTMARQHSDDLGTNPIAIIQVCMGPNDRNETISSITYTPGTDTFVTSGLAGSSTRPGFKNNITTICQRLKDALLADLAYAEVDIYFLFGPYHQIAADPGDWAMQEWYARAEREVCASTFPGKAFRLDGPTIVPAATMLAAGGYDNTITLDYIHLQSIGYELLGKTAGDRLQPFSSIGSSRNAVLMAVHASQINTGTLPV